MRTVSQGDPVTTQLELTMTDETPVGVSPPSPTPPPESRRVTITPAMAEDWLMRNTNNRPLRDEYVSHLAQLMLRGEWKLNGDAIRFSTDFIVLDGQHRLWAVLMAGEENPLITIESFVVFNLPPDTQDTMDAGRRRLLSDVLKMHGEKNTNTLAATLQRLHTWRIGESALRAPSRHALTPPQALAMLENEPQIRSAVKVAARVRNQLGGGGVSQAMIATCLYVFDEIHHEDSLEFWRQVGSGVNLGKHDPAFVLRETLLANKSRRRKMPALLVHAMIIKAWNAFREGREIRMLVWKQGGTGQERFPEPV